MKTCRITHELFLCACITFKGVKRPKVEHPFRARYFRFLLKAVISVSSLTFRRHTVTRNMTHTITNAQVFKHPVLAILIDIRAHFVIDLVTCVNSLLRYSLEDAALQKTEPEACLNTQYSNRLRPKLASVNW